MIYEYAILRAGISRKAAELESLSSDRLTEVRWGSDTLRIALNLSLTTTGGRPKLTCGRRIRSPRILAAFFRAALVSSPSRDRRIGICSEQHLLCGLLRSRELYSNSSGQGLPRDSDSVARSLIWSVRCDIRCSTFCAGRQTCLLESERPDADPIDSGSIDSD